jgi:hypothetical protein
MSDQSVVEIKDPGEAHFEHIYTQIQNRYAGITDFRAKLLGLLPLATGTGAFLLLQRAQDENADLRRFLGPMGIFGLVVTLGCSSTSCAGCSGAESWRSREGT